MFGPAGLNTRPFGLDVLAPQLQFLKTALPRPRWGAYSAPPDPLAGFKGPTSKGREGMGKEKGEKRERKGEREGKGKGSGVDGEGRGRNYI